MGLIFVSFPDYAQQDFPSWIDTLQVEFDEFIQSMSRGRQRLNFRVLDDPQNPGEAWIANSNYSSYANQYPKLNREILFRVKNADDDAFAGLDALMIYHYRCTMPLCPGMGGIADLGMESTTLVDTLGFSGAGSTCVLLDGGSINRTVNRTYVFFNTAHEYGHNLGFSHTPNTWDPPCSSPTPNEYHVNMGMYDCMRQSGSNINTLGFIPYHPATLLRDAAFATWVDDSLITQNVTGLRIPDIRDAGRVFRINVSEDQYYLLANHQGTAFDAKYLGEGLLVWHVIDDFSWDLESAYGKFNDIGPEQTPDPIAGLDLLEYDCTRLGGPEDFFDGSPDEFSCSTNPNAWLYNPGLNTDPQSTPSWLALSNIQQDGPDIVLDVSLNPQLVSSPNGSEVKPVGQAVNVQWNVRSDACVSSVDILLSTNGGSSFGSLAPGESNDGTYSWTPTTLSTQNRIRITSKSGGATIGTDDSNANFTVWGCRFKHSGSRHACRARRFVPRRYHLEHEHCDADRR